MTRSRLVFAVTAVLAATIVFGGVAVAVTTPKKLHACTTANRHVRVLGTTVNCHKGEKRLTWRVSGRKGDPGPTGPAGPRGLRGATGSVGTVHTVTDNSPTASSVAGSVGEWTTWCPTGQQAVGGGFKFGNQAQRDVVQESNPVVGPTLLQGWHVKFVVMPSDPVSHYVNVYALCAVA